MGKGNYRFLLDWLFQCFFDQLLEPGGASVSQQPAVDEDRWGAAHPRPVALSQIPVDQRPDPGVFPVLFELFHVQLELLGNLFDLLFVQAVVVFEEQIVELPELALFFRRQGGGGGRHGKLVVSQREVLEHQFHLVGVFLEHLLEYRHQPGAVRSLEIVEGGDRHRCLGLALEGGAGNIDLLDEIQGDDLNRFGFAAGEEENVLSGARLDALNTLTHRNRAFQLAGRGVDENFALFGENEDPLAVVRHGRVAGFFLQVEGAGHIPLNRGRTRGKPGKQYKQRHQENRKPALHALFSFLRKSIREIGQTGLRPSGTQLTCSLLICQ